MSISTPPWPIDEWDVDAMDAAMGCVLQRVCELRSTRQRAGQPSPALEVDFYDARTLVIVHESGHGTALVWVHRLGAPSGSQMNQPAIMVL